MPDPQHVRHFTVSGSATVIVPGVPDYVHDFHYTAQAADIAGVVGCARPAIEHDAHAAAGMAGHNDYRVIITRFTVQETNRDETNNF